MSEKFNLNDYKFTGLGSEGIDDLRNLSDDDRDALIMAGVDLDDQRKAGTFVHVDHHKAHSESRHEGIEVMDTTSALKKYDGLPEYYWKLVDKEKDDITRKAAAEEQGGYFIRSHKGVKVEEPVQSCLFIKANQAGQAVHNVVIVEEDSELHIITGCAVSKHAHNAAHIGISEFYVKKGGKLTFTMVHNWSEDMTVVPRSAGIVEEGGSFVSNYVLLKPVKYLQMYPTITMAGKGSVSRFNSVMVAPPGTWMDTGQRIILDAPETRGEIIARAITTGGHMINRGHIKSAYAPAKGHLECKGLILGDGVIHAIPELEGSVEGVELSHEAAVGKIAQEEIEYLMARGMDEDEATSTIVRGFLNVDIMGLPKKLDNAVQDQINALDASDAM